jgi:hypothetical protein
MAIEPDSFLEGNIVYRVIVSDPKVVIIIWDFSQKSGVKLSYGFVHKAKVNCIQSNMLRNHGTLVIAL